MPVHYSCLYSCAHVTVDSHVFNITLISTHLCFSLLRSSASTRGTKISINYSAIIGAVTLAICPRHCVQKICLSAASAVHCNKCPCGQ